MTMDMVDLLTPALKAAGFQSDGDDSFSQPEVADILLYPPDQDEGETHWTLQVYKPVEPGQTSEKWPVVLESRVESASQALQHLIAQGVMPAGIRLAMEASE